MNGRVALLVTFRKAKPKSQSLSRSHIRDLAFIKTKSMKKFLNKIFGTNSEQEELKVKSLDEILKLEDETDIVIEIGQRLWDKSKDDKDFESLNSIEHGMRQYV